MEETNHYGLTSARVHGKPGRETRPSTLTVDMHSHIYLPEADAFAGPQVDISMIPMAKYSTNPTRGLNRKQDIERTPNMREYDIRLKDMEQAGIDVQVIMSAPQQCYTTVAPEVAVKAATMVNDEIAAWVSKMPDRFIPLGSVPMQEPEAAVKELERVMGPLGFKGVQSPTRCSPRSGRPPSVWAPWCCCIRWASRMVSV